MPLNRTDFRRKCQLPLLLASGALPALIMLLIHFAPDRVWLAAVFAAAFTALAEACLLVRGRGRLLAGLAGCAALLGLGLWLLPPSGALLAPVCCMGLLGLSLPMGGWPRDKEPPPAWYVAGLVLHLAAQVMVNVSRRTGERPGYIAAAPMLMAGFILFAGLAMLSVNRAGMDQASMGRQRIPASMRRINVLLTVGLLALTLLISALPAVARAVERAWDFLLDLIRRLLDWLSRLLPQSTSTGEMPAESMDMTGLADASAEPSLLAVILEKIAIVLAVVAAVVLAVLAARFLYRRLKKLAKFLRELLRRYAAASCEDYEDEITDTREEGRRERQLPLRSLRRRLDLRDDKSLPPAQRIRRRYALMRMHHAEWQDSRTARETLSTDAACLYERARYSEHPVTDEEAAEFAQRTRSV